MKLEILGKNRSLINTLNTGDPYMRQQKLVIFVQCQTIIWTNLLSTAQGEKTIKFTLCSIKTQTFSASKM